MQVWALGDSWEYGTFGPDALEIVDRADVPFYCGSVQVWSYCLLPVSSFRGLLLRMRMPSTWAPEPAFALASGPAYEQPDGHVSYKVVACFLHICDVLLRSVPYGSRRTFVRPQSKLGSLQTPALAPVPPTCRQYLPYDPERRQGVPVTRFTAAPGMLVRRGYDGLVAGESDAADAAEVRVVGQQSIRVASPCKWCPVSGDLHPVTQNALRTNLSCRCTSFPHAYSSSP